MIVRALRGEIWNLIEDYTFIIGRLARSNRFSQKDRMKTAEEKLQRIFKIAVKHISPRAIVGKNDLNMAERTIMLPAENTKGRKSRYVFFSIKMCRILQKWLRYKDRYSDSNLLFHVKMGTTLKITSFEGNMRKYLLRAGIEKDYSPHALRNNFAKRALMAGMDIYTLSRILGHSSVTVTEKAYLDLSDRDLKQIYQNYSPLENLR